MSAPILASLNRTFLIFCVFLIFCGGMEKLSNLELGDNVDSWYTTYGVVWVAGTLLVFIIQNILITRIGAPSPVPDSQFWMWRNTVISWVHAAVVGFWTLYCIVSYDGMRANPIDFINPSSFAMVVFSTTYFLYDFMDHVLNGKVLQNWEVSLHHVAVSSTFLYNMYIKKCMGYTAYALLTEVNSTFLHLRRLLKLLKVDHNSRLYRLNAVVNIMTCAVFRGAPIFLVSSGFFLHPVIEKLGFPYFLISLMSVTTLSVIQIFLFFRLYKSDFVQSKKTEKISRDVDNNDIDKNS